MVVTFADITSVVNDELDSKSTIVTEIAAGKIEDEWRGY